MFIYIYMFIHDWLVRHVSVLDRCIMILNLRPVVPYSHEHEEHEQLLMSSLSNFGASSFLTDVAMRTPSVGSAEFLCGPFLWRTAALSLFQVRPIDMHINQVFREFWLHVSI
jgi:hypothetical protein